MPLLRINSYICQNNKGLTKHQMEFTAKQIAQLLNGAIEGNADVTVSTLAKIEEGKQGACSFLANPKYTSYAYTSQASVLLVNKTFVAEKPISCTIIRVEDSYSAFAKLLTMFQKGIIKKRKVSKTARVHKTAKIGKNVYIGEFVYVGENVKIGDNSTIFHNVTIHDNCIMGTNTLVHSGCVFLDDCNIGNDCVFLAGAVIGTDGFGFAPLKEGGYAKIPQTGNVIIENDVEIGSNATVDRATMGSTIIHRGAKIDNLTEIAHNCEIGEDTVIVGQTGIAGSTKIGKNVMIGGHTGINGHIKIGDNVRIAAKSGVMTSVADGEIVMGSPAYNARRYKESYVLFKNLKSMETRLKELESELKALKEKQ
jgi:UDP-3-O-[3-hydroxymyristoyl] glucosamine N-acyltransferase